MAGPVIAVTITGDASDASRAFGRLSTDAKEAGQDVERASRDVGDSVRDLGDKVGDTERRFMGLAGGFTGTADVMQGFKDGDLLGMTMGFADLAQFVGDFAGPVLANLLTRMGILTATTATATAATGAQTTAQYALNTAFLANPIFLVVAALAALTAAFVLAWQNSETFREVVTGTFDAIRDTVQAVVDWIVEHWKILFLTLTGPIGYFVLQVMKHWEDIVGGAQWVFGMLQAIFGAIGDFVGKPFEYAYDVARWAAENIVGFFQWMGDTVWGIFDGIRDIVNQVIGGVQWLLDKIPSIPSIPGGGTIRRGAGAIADFANPFAEGGIVTGPTLALIGEAGAEAVIPLDRAFGGGGMLGGGPTVIVNTLVADASTGRAVVAAIQAYERGSGATWRKN